MGCVRITGCVHRSVTPLGTTAVYYISPGTYYVPVTYYIPVRGRVVFLFYWNFTGHHMSWSAARAGLRTRVSRFMGRVDVVIVTAAVHYQVHVMGLGPTSPRKIVTWAGQSGEYEAHIW